MDNSDLLLVLARDAILREVVRRGNLTLEPEKSEFCLCDFATVVNHAVRILLQVLIVWYNRQA